MPRQTTFAIICFHLSVIIAQVTHGFSNPRDLNRQPVSRSHAGETSLLFLSPNDDIKAISTADDDDEEGCHLIFPGGGIFFYWQAGVVSYLREQDYDLSSCTFSGASAGALTATLATADVDFYKATDLALEMAADAGVWDRSGGLQGIWGPMIEDWLDILLPPTIEGIDGRLSLLVTPIPSFGKTKISTFADKQDLIACNMASIHLPWFLNGKLTSTFRDDPHIDGSFLSKVSDYLPQLEKSKHLYLDWTEDPVMESRGGLDIVEALSPKGIWGLLEQGEKHAKVMEEKGIFEGLKKKI